MPKRLTSVGAKPDEIMKTGMKNALVTGGSGDIGAAICRRLAADGCHVYIHANQRLDAAQTLAELPSRGRRQRSAVAFDLTDAAATAAAIESLSLKMSAIQVLVNNAGIHDDAVFPGMRAEQWHRVIDVA